MYLPSWATDDVFLLALAFAGVPFLARLHFTSALSVNADYAGLQDSLPIVEAESAAHARRVLLASKQVTCRAVIEALKTILKDSDLTAVLSLGHCRSL